LGTPTTDRLLHVAEAMRYGFTDEEIHDACKIDPWFLEQMRGIVDMENKVREFGLPETADQLRKLKSMGFADARLAELAKLKASDVLKLRHDLAVRPAYKRIDTLAAEFASPTAYMYSTYETP